MGIINRAVKKVLNNKIKEAEKAYKAEIVDLKEKKKQAIELVHKEACERLDGIDASHSKDKEETLSKHVTSILTKII